MQTINFLAVDPGLNASGWAAFDSSELLGCGCFRTDAELKATEKEEKMAVQFERFKNVGFDLVIEYPQVYRQRMSKGNPASLIQIAILVGMIKGVLQCECVEVLPHRWKGTIPKTSNPEKYIIHKRNLEELNYYEMENYTRGLDCTPKTLRHNVIDAVGLGKWAQKNLPFGKK